MDVLTLTRRSWLVAAAACAAAGCAAPTAAAPERWVEVDPEQPQRWLRDQLAALGTPRWLLLGEQHDADLHQRLHAWVVQALAEQGRLHALVIEMAERGHGTDGLAPDSPQEAIRQALRWNERGWPWQRYGPVVTAAVRAGVPVWGGNLPRAEHARVMREAHWDRVLPTSAHEALLRAIDEGHCGQLPPSQWGPMARIQLARDDAMATTLRERSRADQTTVLVAGQQHVRRDRGVPVHLQRHGAAGDAPGVLVTVAMVSANHRQSAHEASVDAVWLTPATPVLDHCAEWRARGR
jgi:uncharacterized iron-regulated protein